MPQINKNVEYQRGLLTGAAMAHLMEPNSIVLKDDLMRVVKNTLQQQGTVYDEAEQIAKLIVLCNEGYLVSV